MLTEQQILSARILIVDDEPANVVLLERALTTEGYTSLISTTDSRKVLDIYQENKPDLILLDLMMPFMDGFEVMSHLKQIADDTYLPILVLTARQDRQARIDALASGAKDFLSKPLDLVEVRLRIRNMLKVRLLYNELARSITDFELANAALARSNADLAQFASIASHDLREPIRTIKNYVQFLHRRLEGKLDSDAQEFIAFVLDAADRMQALITSLLTYAKTGVETVYPAPTNCETLLNAVIRDLGLHIQEANATVTYDSLPTVRADPAQLRQLLQNLVNNAIKFRRTAPEVHISAAQQGAEWVISVRDNGIGIEPEYQERIFLLFQRLHAQGTYSGSGIGLAVCKRIVERHGGRIWVESEPNSGSTFFFTLPA